MINGQTKKQETMEVREITISCDQSKGDFPHYWEKMVGAGHAALALREDYRKQLKEAVDQLGFQYIRFHGIFNDDLSVYQEDAEGNPIYNFTQIDLIYDYFLKIGIRPCVELGFMPKDLAKDQAGIHDRWRYRTYTVPPKDFKKWHDLVKAFTQHCVDRYGIEEVRQWYFEVWNEFDLRFFWHGTPQEYFQLYAESAKAIKSVDEQLQVGGPGVTVAPRAKGFLKMCQEKKLPLDFFSSHAYGATWFLDGDGARRRGIAPYNALLQRIMSPKRVLKDTPYADVPIFVTEWSITPSSRDIFHDMPFSGPFICQVVKDCYGKVGALSYWTFSDIFEERGFGLGEFHGGFGLSTLHGIHKPSWVAYQLLHQLGDELLYLEKKEALIATKKEGEGVQILAWNYCHPRLDINFGMDTLEKFERPPFLNEKPRSWKVRLENLEGEFVVKRYRLDPENGDIYQKWIDMGRPQSLTQEQENILKKVMGPKTLAEEKVRASGVLDIAIKLPAHGVELIKIQPIS